MKTHRSTKDKIKVKKKKMGINEKLTDEPLTFIVESKFYRSSIIKIWLKLKFVSETKLYGDKGGVRDTTTVGLIYEYVILQ